MESDTNMPAPSQRWGVWSSIRDEWTVLTVERKGFDSKSEAQQHADDFNNAHEGVYFNVRPYPAPTPPAKVEVDGPWIIHENADGSTFLHNPTLAWNDVRTFEVPRNNITWLRDILNKQHAENARLRACLTMGASLETPEFLEWLASRLVGTYGESENVDFVISLRQRATAMRTALGGAKC